jgi:hypothetical protein
VNRTTYLSELRFIPLHVVQLLPFFCDSIHTEVIFTELFFINMLLIIESGCRRILKCLFLLMIIFKFFIIQVKIRVVKKW